MACLHDRRQQELLRSLRTPRSRVECMSSPTHTSATIPNPHFHDRWYTTNMRQESVPLLTALPQSPSKPTLKLGTIDCETNEILCVAWSVGSPAIWHFMTPATSVSPEAPTDLRIIRLNVTTAQVDDIISIPSSSGSRYLDYKPYDGLLHPINGAFQKFGVSVPFGYLLWALGAVPSWLMMLLVSFGSRQIMSKRMGDSPGLGGGAPPAAAGAGGPAQPAPASAGKASPAGGKKQKKR